MLSFWVFHSPNISASEPNEINAADLLALAKQTLSTDFKGQNFDRASENVRSEFEYMDAVLENVAGEQSILVQDDQLQSSRFFQYFKAYSNLSKVEDYTDDTNYQLLLTGSESSNWDVQHMCSTMLAIFHALNDDIVEGLFFAENALSIIPNQENFIENNARFNATYGLYILYAFNYDIEAMTRTLERLLVLANQTGRQFNKFSTLNNLASIIESNGNAKLAAKITNLLVNNLDAASEYDVFIANLSHGRFLLKDNRPKKAIEYLTRAIELSPNVEYEAFLLIDLANAQAKSGLLKAANSSLAKYKELEGLTTIAFQYAARYSGETRALIATGKKQYKKALNEYKAFMQEQIKYYKDGLSADRRAANRRVLLSQELAEKELEKAELKLALDHSRLARQQVINRIYLGFILLGAFITIVAIMVARKMENLNEKLKVANAAVIEKSKVKSDLLAMFSHEMLTPLNGIIPLADVLQQDETDGKKLNLLKMIERNGAELTRKIKDIILISNPRDQKNNPILLNAEDFLKRMLVQYQNDLTEGVTLNVHMDPLVPEHLYLDKSRLETIVKALLSNAFKYTKQGEIRLSIYIKDDKVPVMEISDTGKGMPSDNVGNMLRPFEQASLSINRDNQGLGLGLSIVRLQCLVMDAVLDVQSEENVGTVVKVSFPNAIISTTNNHAEEQGLKEIA